MSIWDRYERQAERAQREIEQWPVWMRVSAVPPYYNEYRYPHALKQEPRPVVIVPRGGC